MLLRARVHIMLQGPSMKLLVYLFPQIRLEEGYLS